MIKDIKTTCCNASWKSVSKLNYRCTKCNKDVTYEIILIYKAIKDDHTRQNQTNRFLSTWCG